MANLAHSVFSIHQRNQDVAWLLLFDVSTPKTARKMSVVIPFNKWPVLLKFVAL